MDIDGMSSDQPATLREVPQVQEPPIPHTELPSSNGMRRSARCYLFPVIRHAVCLTCLKVQAPNTANLSERSPSKCTFAGQKEILGYTWGVPQFRWIQQDTRLKLVSHRSTQLWPTLNRHSDLVRSGPLDLNGLNR
jgi:hypothetical protein